jgi:integrase
MADRAGVLAACVRQSEQPTDLLEKCAEDMDSRTDLRATFASRLAAAGVPDIFISQMMGHAGGLLQTYAKAITEYRRDAIRKLEAYRESASVKPVAGLSNNDLVQ